MKLFSAQQNAFYDGEELAAYEHAGTLPADVIEVSEGEWQTYGQNNAPIGMQRAADANGHPTWVEIPPLSLDDIAAQAEHRINAGYTKALSAILNQYPEAETLSFDKQEREARTWAEWQAIGGTEPATPYLDAMLVERPIGKGELVSRIITKADLFIAAHGKATGKRQRLEHNIKVAAGAEDRATLETIGW